MKKFITITLIITMILTIPIYAENTENTQFTDIANHWAKEIIQNLVNKQILNGYPDGTFNPEGNITRAEMTKVICKAVELEIIEGNAFTDTANHWAKNEINTLVQNKTIIPEEYGQNFEPDVKITRVEIAKMIVKAMELDKEVEEYKDKKTKFLDDKKIKDTDKGFVSVASDKEITNGYPDGTFRPDLQATRAEVCQMITNMFQIVETKKEDKYAELRTEEGYINADDLPKYTFEEKGYDFKEELIKIDGLFNVGEVSYEPDKIIEITKDMLPIKYFSAEITDYSVINYDDVFFKGENSFYWGLGASVGIVVIEVNAVKELDSVGFEARFIDKDGNMLGKMGAYQVKNNDDKVEKKALGIYPNLPLEWVSTPKGEKCTFIFQKNQDVLDKTTKILLIDDLSSDKGDILEIPIK